MLSTRSRLFGQNTIARSAAIDGVGIHTGKKVELRLHPAPANSGIRFRRLDSGGVEISALASNISSLELATTIGRDDVTISTIEHLMAAVHLAEIDNLLIEIDGPEVPILDGSALPYCRLLEAAGIRRQNASRRILAITEPIETEVDGRGIRISPYPGLRVSYVLDYEIPSIGRQTLDLKIDGKNFLRELVPARTFTLLSDVEKLHQAGLGLGGREDNCVVFDGNGPINTKLRFADEPVRHKALDALGDLALLGCPLWGHLEVDRGGHEVLFALIEELKRRPSSWTWVRAQADEQVPLTDMGEAPELGQLPTGSSNFGKPAAEPQVS